MISHNLTKDSMPLDANVFPVLGAIDETPKNKFNDEASRMTKFSTLKITFRSYRSDEWNHSNRLGNCVNRQKPQVSSEHLFVVPSLHGARVRLTCCRGIDTIRPLLRVRPASAHQSYNLDIFLPSQTRCTVLAFQWQRSPSTVGIKFPKIHISMPYKILVSLLILCD